MKVNLIYIALVSSVILFSCEKDDHLINDKTNNPLTLISKVLVNGGSSYEYLYNAANLISEEKNNFQFIKHIYNEKNLLTESDFYFDFSLDSSNIQLIKTSTNQINWVNPQNTEKSLSEVFEYNANGQLVKITFKRPLSINPEISEFSYTNDRISRQTMYYDNKISGHIDYVYDARGNLSKMTKYVVSAGNDDMMTTTYYEYDNMQNPFKSFKTLMDPGINTNPNNIIKETYTISFAVASSIDKVQITQTSYDYNDKGYPIRVNGTMTYVYK